jgi:hypothetical protein
MASCFITCHNMHVKFLMRRYKVLASLFLRIQVLWDDILLLGAWFLTFR